MKFTVEIDCKSPCLLYLEITIYEKNIVTSAYIKPFDCHFYVDGTWCYPTSSIDGIWIGAVKRLNEYAPLTINF